MSSATIRAYVVAHRRSLGIAFAGGVLTVVALGGVIGLATVAFGLYDTAASTPHSRPVAWALHTSFLNSVRRRSGRVIGPADFTSAQVAAGLRQYVADCEICHGGPGVARARWVQQLEPSPPYIIDSARRFTQGQLYFILLKGVKMSAMPAWGETRSTAQLWNYVAFLRTFPTLSACEYARLRSSPAGDLRPDDRRAAWQDVQGRACPGDAQDRSAIKVPSQ